MVKEPTNSYGRKPLRKVSGNFNRFKGLVMKYLKTSARDKPMYFWVFGYPLLFMVIFSFGLKQSESASYEIAIVTHDGTPLEGQTNATASDDYSNVFIELFDPDNPDSDLSETFNVHEGLSEEEARAKVKKSELHAVVILPANFTEMIALNQTPTAIVYTISDPVTSSVVPSVMKSIIDQIILSNKDVKTVEIEASASGGEITYFDYILPGLVIAGITVAIMNVSEIFSKEKEANLMQRLDTTPVPRNIQLLAGGAAQVIYSSIQTVILLGCLVVFGVKIHEDANWALAFLMAIVLALSCIGIGLIIAALAKDTNSASGISWIVILPLQFFGGAVGMMLNTPIDKYTPTHWAVKGMQAILINGLGWADVVENLVINLIVGIVCLAIGLVIFNKKTQI